MLTQRQEPQLSSILESVQAKNELRANASSVDTDLGGGDHGYLGFVLNNVEYTKVAPTHPFTAPDFPGPLVVPLRTNMVDAMNLREVH